MFFITQLIAFYAINLTLLIWCHVKVVTYVDTSMLLFIAVAVSISVDR